MTEHEMSLLQAGIEEKKKAIARLDPMIDELKEQMTEYILLHDPKRRGGEWMSAAQEILDARKNKRLALTNELQKMYSELKQARKQANILATHDLEHKKFVLMREKLKEVMGLEAYVAWMEQMDSELK